MPGSHIHRTMYQKRKSRNKSMKYGNLVFNKDEIAKIWVKDVLLNNEVRTTI